MSKHHMSNPAEKNVPLHKICVECPSHLFNIWRLRAARMRHELRRHKITDSERRLAEAILDITFGWGRE